MLIQVHLFSIIYAKCVSNAITYLTWLLMQVTTLGSEDWERGSPSHPVKLWTLRWSSSWPRTIGIASPTKFPEWSSHQKFHLSEKVIQSILELVSIRSEKTQQQAIKHQKQRKEQSSVFISERDKCFDRSEISIWNLLQGVVNCMLSKASSPDRG